MATSTAAKTMKAREVKYVDKVDAVITRERKGIVVERELDKIYAEHGMVTPDLIIDLAKDDGHPLHKHFEWDDAVAGEKYRRAQASSMILASKFVAVLSEQRGIPNVVAAKPLEVRKFLPQHRSEGFRMRKEIMGDAESRQYVIERKISVLRSWLRETVDVSELATVREVIEKAIEGMG